MKLRTIPASAGHKGLHNYKASSNKWNRWGRPHQIMPLQLHNYKASSNKWNAPAAAESNNDLHCTIIRLHQTSETHVIFLHEGAASYCTIIRLHQTSETRAPAISRREKNKLHNYKASSNKWNPPHTASPCRRSPLHNYKASSNKWNRELAEAIDRDTPLHNYKASSNKWNMGHE